MVKLRFTWFTTRGFILFLAHPILLRKTAFILIYLFRDEAAPSLQKCIEEIRDDIDRILKEI
ncbi:MAG: hypothetical protein DRH15_08310 [Deltaproteobacteria bacterium]|nr:MAG: hypothetical protein DRH15_08310 [Deltaproteobacteria bacterium]